MKSLALVTVLGALAGLGGGATSSGGSAGVQGASGPDSPPGRAGSVAVVENAAVGAGTVSDKLWDSSSAPWAWPLRPNPEVVRPFDPPDQRWSAGHRGIDLAGAVGAPVIAPANGIVTFSGPVAGRGIVTIRIGDVKSSIMPVSHRISQGSTVERGDVVARVADNGHHCPSQICLHWGVRRHGKYIDPLRLVTRTGDASVLLPLAAAPNPADERARAKYPTFRGGTQRWGGFANGRIPAKALCPIRHDPSELLRCDAARSMAALDRAFHNRFGTHIGITDAYRDYATQVRLKREKGYLAATPGHSNHGWGVAVDFGSGINRFASATYRWMKANARRFGWHHPSWAEPGSSKPEPWHWEFG